MSYISDLANYLQAQNVGTVGTNIFYSYMPDDVEVGVALFDTGGNTPDPYLPTHEPTFQAFIRGTDYDTGKALLEEVRDALHQISGQTIGDTYFYFILANAEGGHIGRNERGDDEFSINFRCRTR
jgi:hypothetical protein